MIALFKKGIALVPVSFRRHGYLIIFLLTVGSLLDLFSIATFLPLMFLIGDSHASNSPVLIEVSRQLQITDAKYLLLLLTVFSVTFVFIKSQLINTFTRKKAAFAYAVADQLASYSIERH